LLRWLGACLPQRSFGFNPMTVHVRISWMKWHRRRFISELFWFSLLIITPPLIVRPCHCPVCCAIIVIRQHIITYLVYKFGSHLCSGIQLDTDKEVM
jgi:hypothetical protein